MANVTSKKAELLEDIKQTFGQIPGWIAQIPDAALEGFWKLQRDFQLTETRIPNKYKELIGLAVSGATRCRYCTLFHTEAARLNGATDEEIAEASMMGGFTMAASTFLNAQQTDYEEFAKETREIVSYIKNQQAKKQPGAARAVPH